MTLEDQAREVAELRRQACEALAGGKIEEWLNIICRRTNAVERLQDALLERSVVVAKDPDAVRILREIDLAEIEHLDAFGRRLLYSMPIRFVDKIRFLPYLGRNEALHSGLNNHPR